MSRKLAKRWITADEYERMGEAGIFAQDARLELIEGEIYEMSPIGSPHAACVTFLSRLLNLQFSDTMIVSTQNPIRLNDFSEPQPDVALLRWRDDFYRREHPRPADVLLVIEVADSTVETDRTVKMPLYAQAGITEAWLVNLPESRVEIYSDPSNGVYQTMKHATRGEEAQSVNIPQLCVVIAELLG
ncbi:MAG: Uma2 family endonuclease [Acidobacteria bacterium]|nr:Uma2 family endonuclease [Acidobacteriota bacterium]